MHEYQYHYALKGEVVLTGENLVMSCSVPQATLGPPANPPCHPPLFVFYRVEGKLQLAKPSILFRHIFSLFSTLFPYLTSGFPFP